MGEWIITCNQKKYNVDGAFKKLEKLNWKQSTNVEIGDFIYIYVGAPIQAIRFKCLATMVDLEEVTIDDSEYVIDGSNYENYVRYMELELIEKYNTPLLNRRVLLENGLKTVQGPSKVSDELSGYIFTSTEKANGLKKTKKEAITILIRALNRPVTAREITDLMYTKEKHQSIVFSELAHMEQIGILDRTGAASQYYFDLHDKKNSPRYFYVFQNQSFVEEISGGYLWAPKKAKDNSENHNWSRMKDVKKGDVIFHGYKQHVAAVSVAKVDGYSAQRPEELSDEWNNDGWRIDADYYMIPNPISPKEIWVDLQQIQPSKYAPFDKNGNGNMGYLYDMNQEMARMLLLGVNSVVDPEVNTLKPIVNTEYEDSEIEVLLSEKQAIVLDALIKQFVKNLPEKELFERELETLRAKFVNDFKMQKIINMNKEEYVVGLGSKDTFCYRIETELQELGNIHGSPSAKFGLYFGKSGEGTEEKYRNTKRYGEDTNQALEKIKEEIVLLLIAGQNKDLEAIRGSLIAPLYRGKLLAVYFPEEYLCIFSDEHLEYFMMKLEIDFSQEEDILDKQKKLLEWKNSRNEMKDWSTHLFSNFLYTSFGRPFEEHKRIKDLQDERDKKYPREYVTKISITIGMWKDLLQNKDIFTDKDIEFIKRIYMADNHATTCNALGIQDGVSPSSYIKPVVSLAKRIANEISLPPIYGDDGKQTWWRILFWGSYKDDGHFEWKLRPKLVKALVSTYPELNEIVNAEVEEQEDNNLIEELKQASLDSAETGFSYSGKSKKKQPPAYTNGHRTYPRDRQTAINALAHAHYECEIDNNHPGFIRKRSDKNYTEPHHLVPMSYSDKFDVSLDVEENIISMCSNCHNQIHYGRDAKGLIEKIYRERKSALISVGIVVSLEQLLSMYKILLKEEV